MVCRISRGQTQTFRLVGRAARPTKAQKALKREAEELARQAFLEGCRLVGVPLPRFEFKFHPVRKFRFDAAWPMQRLALEIQGGLFTGGRHVRGAALLREHDKLNAAAILGWRVLYTTPADVASGAAYNLLRDAFTSCFVTFSQGEHHGKGKAR